MWVRQTFRIHPESIGRTSWTRGLGKQESRQESNQAGRQADQQTGQHIIIGIGIVTQYMRILDRKLMHSFTEYDIPTS